MRKTTKTLLLSAMISGLAGGFSVVASADDAAGNMGGDGFECHGANACKGKGACGGTGHSCAGKNECKGKGWVKSKDEAECKMMKEKMGREGKKKKS